MERLRNTAPTVNMQHLNADQARMLRAQQGQLEALGVNRRQCLTESEFREKRGAIPRASDLEATRRVNLRDTVESRVSDNVKGLLSGWSRKQKAQSPQLVIPNQGIDAWTTLANDDGARENLQDINAGQTHRANLTLRVSEQQSDDASDFFDRNSGDARSNRVDRARGGGRGGRGGGILSSRRGRVGPTRVPIGLEPIAEASASTVAKGSPTTRGSHHVLSPLNGLSRTNGTIFHGRPSGDLAARSIRHALSPLPTPTHPSRDSTIRQPPPNAKHGSKSTTSSDVGSARWESYPLADPETFMAKAGRQSEVKLQSTKTASEIMSSDEAEHALPSVQRALSASSQDLVMLDPCDTDSNMEEALPAPKSPKETMPARTSMANSEAKTQTVRSETRVRDPLSEQLNRTVQALVMDDTVGIEKQRALEQDREKLQRLREIVAQMGGLFCADILSHIETLEGRLSPPATADLEVSNGRQTALPSSLSPSAVIAQADTLFDQFAHNTATPRQELPPDTSSSQKKIVQVQAEPSERHDSNSSINDAEATGVSAVRMTETATASHRAQSTLTTDAKAVATATASMHIKEVKQNTVKIGAIFGEHIQMSHFLARPPNDSIASSVATTADEIGSVSASFSRLMLHQRESSRSVTAAHPTAETAAIDDDATTQPPKSPEEKRTRLSQSKPTTLGSLEDATALQPLPESTSLEDSQSTTVLSPLVSNKPLASDESIVTPKITMRKDPKLADNVFTRQYSSHVVVSPQVSASSQSRFVNKPSPAFGETAGNSTLTVQQSEFKHNPISRQPATHSPDSTEPGYASTNPFAQQQGSVDVSPVQSVFSTRNDTSPFSKRFSTAPYRRDETSARADRIKDSSVAKPMPRIPDFLRTSKPETQDPGAAARRQYEDPVNRRSPIILSERVVSQQMNYSEPSSIRSGFQNAHASITTSNPLVRPFQGSATSENLRPSEKKASQDAAGCGPK